MYHGFVHGLAQRVLEYVRRAGLLVPGDRVGVAVSGGGDSVALLRILLELRPELGLVLSVVHFNHKLRGAESDADEAFVSELARAHKLQFRNSSADVRRHSAEHKISVETAARQLRHGFFTKLLSGDNNIGEKGFASVLDKIATAHTLDDQAETVLMRMIRGTGGRGLAGIYPRVKIGGSGAIVRPLLGVRRRELEQYLGEVGQEWREDATNRELKFTRNRVRHSVLPLLERDFNPAITERLSELAEIARAEEDYWDSNAAAWTGAAVQWQTTGGGAEKAAQAAPSNAPQRAAGSPVSLPNENPCNACVNRSWLLAESVALQRRLVKSVGEQAGVMLEFKHVDEILRFAGENQPSGKELALPKGWKLLQQGESLLFVGPSSAAAESSRSEDGYEYRFTVPGSVEVREIGSRFELVVVEKAASGYDADDLLDLALLSNPLIVRNWRAGDRFWPARRKSEKKVKELLAELNMPQSERKMWPVIVSANEVVWVRGFPVAAKFRVQGSQRDRIFVREISRG